MPEINAPDTIRNILAECRNIAVVGLSSDPMRPSYDVAAYMQRHGYRIIPVTPKDAEVLGERACKSLEEIPEKVDLVNIFRRADQAGQHVDEAIRIGARAVWMQFDVIDAAAAARAQAAGLWVVMDRCLMVEHARNQR
ncbi:MAG: CoA-binding protein [Blastocatellia bacterium]